MQTPRFHHLLVTALLATAFIVLPHSARAQTPTITVLHDFTRLDGSYPTNGLLLASDGNFYGTTPTGGPGTFTGADYGTVFRITQAGVFTNLVNFTSDNGTNPYAPPIEGSDGDLYGTTAGGGPLGPTRNGTVFKMTKAGVLTTLLEFPYDPTTDTFPNGLSPQAALVQGSDGNYYGTTVGGGTPNIQNTAGHGTIFEMSPAGALLQSVTVHQSNGEPGDPRAPLIQASNGNFYGTSYEGGGDTNAGTIFEFTPEGVLTTLHSFVGGAGNTGDRPYDGLLQGSDGNFYGTTEYGGTAELGTVFKISPAGDYTVLVNFTGPNGEQPFASLIQASDGNFYGTASLGGTDSLGTIFQLTPAGVFTTIYNFSKNEALGAFPRGALVQGSDGNLYGTTMGGGANAFGTVFRLNIVPQAALFNISTRLNVGTGDNVLIGGFIVTGTQPKEVIVRAIGPALSGFGVSGALANPVLELHEPDGTVITNDNWKDTQESAITATNLAPSNDLESAIVATLPPGLYTAIVTGNNNTTGVALVEAYDLDQTVDSQLANISTRGFVDTGDNVLIGGFIVGGPDGVDSTAVVRALGPSLSGAVGGSVLADPNLELHDIDGAVVASNDNWKDGADMQTIIDDGLAPTNAKESALLANLPPGAYTAIVSGVENGSGIGLVEVYNLQ